MQQRETVLLFGLAIAAGLWWYSRTQQGAAMVETGSTVALDFVDVTASRVGNYFSSRGYRNNNPGNLRYLQANAWNGQVSNDGGYAVYDSPENGTRALGHQLMKYARAGKNTVSSIIYTWAPPAENNAHAYVVDVAQALGVDPDQVIDVSARLADLAQAIARHENGYVDGSYNWQWVYLT